MYAVDVGLPMTGLSYSNEVLKKPTGRPVLPTYFHSNFSVSLSHQVKLNVLFFLILAG